MSDDETARLALPLLSAGQAQKELTHNEALTVLDLLAQPVVVAVGIDMPPDTPLPGQCWIVGVAPDGLWTGYANHFAGWTTGGWRLVAPVDGMLAWSIADVAEARFRDGAWEVGSVRGTRLEIGGIQLVGSQQPAIADPAGGAAPDAEARTAIAAILAALRGHGLIAA